MAIPKYHQLYRPVLELMSDGKSRSLNEIKKCVANCLSLSEADLKIALPSGRETSFSNRLRWSCWHLGKAGLLEKISRSTFIITDEGKKALPNAPQSFDNKYLMNFEPFRDFMESLKKAPTETGKDPEEEIPEETETPDDILEKTLEQINQSLADDLLTEVLKLSPTAFEQFVLDLMRAMGYGTFDKASKTTAITGDEGIDGIIMEDKLGFDLIYVQAKRWDPKQTVGRPEIMAFVGAIAGKDAKGLFVTTAKFSDQAIKYAQNQHIILIDGQKLVRLMIEHNFGVTVKRTFSIKSLDTDIFNDYQDL